jgi:sulfite exporter TauE/SafE/copper chaperone CopZ
MSADKIVKLLKIEGMTCANCESIIERGLNKIRGVISSEASYSSGNVKVTFDKNIVKINEIIRAIEALDYIVKDNTVNNKSGKTNPSKHDLGRISEIAASVIVLYFLLSQVGKSGIFNVFPQAEAGMSYSMLFIIGLLSSVHCIGMCGGINISQCIPTSLKSNTKTGFWQTASPSLQYNLGRVISYTIIGGIVGSIGSVISFSGAMKGVVQIAAGIFMVIMGINMLNLFPGLRKLNLRMPKSLASKISRQKNGKGPLFVGLLNGLMPCGPLQAMQLYALSTGSPVKGALSMLLFSLGTVPLMFALGALSSSLNKKFTSRMLTASAVLVIVLGMTMFSSGAGLSNLSPAISVKDIEKIKVSGVVASIDNGVQSVYTELSPGSYEPIVVEKGTPVRWIINAEQKSINGCNNEIAVPEYNLNIGLMPGENVIEFFPEESGTFGFSCWMGMIRSKITVVDSLADIE